MILQADHTHGSPMEAPKPLSVSQDDSGCPILVYDCAACNECGRKRNAHPTYCDVCAARCTICGVRENRMYCDECLRTHGVELRRRAKQREYSLRNRQRARNRRILDGRSSMEVYGVTIYNVVTYPVDGVMSHSPYSYVETHPIPVMMVSRDYVSDVEHPAPNPWTHADVHVVESNIQHPYALISVTIRGEDTWIQADPGASVVLAVQGTRDGIRLLIRVEHWSIGHTTYGVFLTNKKYLEWCLPVCTRYSDGIHYVEATNQYAVPSWLEMIKLR